MQALSQTPGERRHKFIKVLPQCELWV